MKKQLSKIQSIRLNDSQTSRIKGGDDKKKPKKIIIDAKTTGYPM